jgi:hypothetical protein
MLPSAAAAFALGLLGWSAVPAWVGPSMALVVGFTALGIGWIAAGRERVDRGALARARLVPPDHGTVEAVASRRVTAGAGAIAAAVITLTGVLVLGAGWSGIHHRGLHRALLASLAPQRVVLEGALKTDPKQTSLGWSATALVRRVEWPDGAATLR